VSAISNAERQKHFKHQYKNRDAYIINGEDIELFLYGYIEQCYLIAAFR
jgi:hypothetical protein